MNCPQCQAANSPGSAFCANCGTRMAVAETAAPAGYPPPQGYSAPGDTPPVGYSASQDNTIPRGYAASPGYQDPQGYSAPGGYDAASPQQSGYPAQGPYQPPSGGAPRGPRQSGLPPVSFDHTRLDRTDKIIAVGTFIAVISIWLPWYSISWGSGTFQNAGSASISGTTGHGWLWLEFFVALLLLGYLAARAAWDRLPVTLPVEHAPLLIVATSLQLLLVLIAFIDIPSGSEGVGGDGGAFIALLAALAAAGPVVVPAVRSYLARRKATGGPTY